MKYFHLVFVLLLLTNCNSENKTTTTTEAPAAVSNTAAPKVSHHFFVGTYTNTDSKGIYKYSLEHDGTLKKIGVAAISNNPSYLAWSANKQYLLAVNEKPKETGVLTSYSVTRDSLILINQTGSGGLHPCFVSTNKAGFVLVTNYNGGNMGLLKLNNNGAISSLLDLKQHSGKGTTERQKAPHPHSAWFAPNSNDIISVDLGTNELWFYQLDTLQNKLKPSNPAKLAMAVGAGPRHLSFHPNGKWIYVLNELNATVTLLVKSTEGQYNKSSVISTLPKDYAGPNSCADIHVSSDGKFVYASNRGHNSIAIFKINDTNGALSILGYEPTKGEWPRNFSLSPDNEYLLVANQHTNNIVSYKRDNTTGLLKYVHQIDVPAPVCILF